MRLQQCKNDLLQNFIVLFNITLVFLILCSKEHNAQTAPDDIKRLSRNT